MKLFVFTDIHGNLSALKDLSNTKDFIEADKRIFLGDIIAGYSRPNECIEYLQKLDCEYVLGNNDSYVCDHIPLEEYQLMSPQKLKQIEYFIDLVKPENKKWVLSKNKELYLEVSDKKFYFVHYPWDSPDNIIDSPVKKNLEERQKMFSNIEADYIIFGHEHYQSNCFEDGKKLYYCLGSAGIKNPSPYLVIDIGDDGKVNIEEKSIPNNLDLEVDLTEIAGYPYNKNKLRKH